MGYCWTIKKVTIVLTVSNIGKSWQSGVLFEDVSFKLDSSACMLLMGPTGSGKTTLLRIIAGLESSERGRIEWKGQVWLDKDYDSPPRDRSISMMFQDFGLWPSVNVLDHVRMTYQEAIKRKRQIKFDISEIIEACGLCGLEKKNVDELSGGQKQRVSMARAVAAHAGLLLLDEPLSNQDSDMQSKLIQFLAQIKSLGSSIIISTHTPKPLNQLTDSSLSLTAPSSL